MKKTKSPSELKQILIKEKKGRFKPFSVLIPRAIRRKGRVHLIQNDMFVSTNFLVCYEMSQRDAILLSTWISSVFFQLNCEVSSKDEAGLRKMEVTDILSTVIPNFAKVTNEEYYLLRNCIQNADFIDLQNPTMREIDRIWSQILFGSRAVQLLSEAEKLLSYVASRRNEAI